MAHVVLAELKEEARLEARMARFDAADDDTSAPPEASPLDSAQAKRAQRVEVAA